MEIRPMTLVYWLTYMSYLYALPGRLTWLNTALLLHLITFFYSVLRPFQDYFSSYETGQSVGGAKTGEPREKPPDIPACRTWLVSHVARAGLESTPDTAVR